VTNDDLGFDSARYASGASLEQVRDSDRQRLDTEFWQKVPVERTRSRAEVLYVAASVLRNLARSASRSQSGEKQDVSAAVDLRVDY